MWRPNTVVPEHKRRAAVLWVLLIFSIISYTIYLFVKTSAKAKNAATFSVVSDEVYRYPDVWMCLYRYYGCDEQVLEEECVASANNTEGGSVKAVYHPGGENEQNISTYYTLTATTGWCVVFKTSEVVIELGNTRDLQNYLDYVILDMSWYPGGAAVNSTTCVSEDGEWKEHTESLFVFLGDTEFGTLSPGVLVPYTCMTNESTTNTFTRMGIELTKKRRLDSSKNENLYEGTIASTTSKIERTAEITGIQAPYAHIQMSIYQRINSLQEVSDIDPFEVAEMLGNIGGFWDLLMIFWPIFFVAAVNERPTFKFRNFRRSLINVATGAHTITSSVSARMAHTRALPKSELQKEHSICERSSQESKVDEVLIRLFEEHGLVAVVNGTRIATFLKAEFNARPLEDGASEPSLKELIPANTYLVVVPPGHTPTAIAKDVASYCKLGGDNIETFHADPITVKAKKVHCSAVQAHALSLSEYVGASNEVCIESDVDLGEARPFFAMPKRTASTQHPLEVEAPQRKVSSR